jgi:hypothetical protein
LVFRDPAKADLRKLQLRRSAAASPIREQIGAKFAKNLQQLESSESNVVRSGADEAIGPEWEFFAHSNGFNTLTNVDLHYGPEYLSYKTVDLDWNNTVVMSL